MLRIFGIAGFLFFAAGAGQALACWVPWIRTIPGMTMDNSMTVKSGKSCSINFRSAGPTDRHTIAQRPKNGSLQVGDVGRITYRSRAGYVGNDSFVYVRSGRDMSNNRGDRTVRIAVTVTP